MLSFTGSLKVFVVLDPVDMRKGFEGLHAAVGEKLKADVRGGAIFALPASFGFFFAGCLAGARLTNKRRTRLKVLYFDGTSLWLMTKRLEQGTFFWPKAAEPGQSGLMDKGTDTLSHTLHVDILKKAHRYQGKDLPEGICQH